jgi:hypothetical protein
MNEKLDARVVINDRQDVVQRRQEDQRVQIKKAPI